MPSWEANCIDDWEQKVLEIAKETLKEDMLLLEEFRPGL